VDGLVYAFTGDLIHSSGKVWTVHDLDWWYGGLEGFRSAVASSSSIRRCSPDRLAPSHGEVIDDPAPALAALEDSLLGHLRCITRPALPGPPGDEFATGRFELVAEGLVAVTHTCANFYVLLGDAGEALFFDYGFAGEHHFKAGFRFVEHSLDVLRDRFGVERPAVVVPTHYHDDHVAGIGFLHRRFDTEVWAFDGFADVLERPWRYRIPCLWQAPVRISRRIREGETIDWNGTTLETRHAPGHTWYAAAFLGEIAGRRVAVTGDAVSRDLNGGLWGGGPVYRNRLGIGDFSTTAELLLSYEPELLLTGHRGVVPVSRTDLEGFAGWAREYSKTVAQLLPDPASGGFHLDPDIVSILPYQAEGRPGEPVELEVEVRNPCEIVVDAGVRLVLPGGWSAQPESGSSRVDPGENRRIRVSIVAPPNAARDVRHVVLADVTLGSRRLGQAAESLIVLR
jgi:glyoxylase-like metal-dependent hydrolase (beta-lactamase superfamily II)